VTTARSAAPALAPDPAVPARDVLLDGDVMAARLARLMGADGPAPVGAYRRGRAKYRVGESLRVVHEIEVGGAPVLVASRTFRNGRSREVYEASLEAARDAAPLRGVAHDPELHAVFWAFPNDRKLATLSALTAGGDAVGRLLGRPVGGTVLAAYAPEKSATAACLDPADGRPFAYAKVFASLDELDASHRAHAAIAAALGPADSLLRVPSVLAVSEAQRMLVVEAVEGRRIDALRGPEQLQAMRRFGAALATLHSLPIPDGLPRFARLDPERQAQGAELLGRARPDVAGAAQRLVAELGAAAPPADAPVCLHGDVHPKNGLLQGRRVALIDLDQAGPGSAAAELGSALAGLRYHALVADEAARGERLQRALLDGYAERRDLPEADALRWHVAAAMLTERALRALNRVRPEGLARLGAVLGDARAALRGEVAA
jgi:aminoglycoside phosphotransferase (APT) family kinase protein